MQARQEAWLMKVDATDFNGRKLASETILAHPTKTESAQRHCLRLADEARARFIEKFGPACYVFVNNLGSR